MSFLNELIRDDKLLPVIKKVADVLDDSICVTDSDGGVLWGSLKQGNCVKYPVIINKELYGWVIGLDGAEIMAEFINSLAAKELKKRSIEHEKNDKVREINLLYNIYEKISSSLDLKRIGSIILEEIKHAFSSTSSSIMLYNEKINKFEIMAGYGYESNRKIVLRPGEGIAGNVFMSQKPEVINDVFSDCRFVGRTNKIKSMICAPLITDRKIIGIMNISSDKPTNYSDEDFYFFSTLASQVASAIERSQIHEALESAYRELKDLYTAKEKMIAHLSHELKTPISIIGVTFSRLSSKLAKQGFGEFEKPIDRGIRSYKRLLNINYEIEDILQYGYREYKKRLVDFIEDLIFLIEDTSGELPDEEKKNLRLLYDKIETIYKIDDIIIETIRLDEFLNALCDEVEALIPGRDLEITRDLDKDIVIEMDKSVLKKISVGLLRNAVENTPDQGKISVNLKQRDSLIVIRFHDYGVGISPQHQKLIFEGFFHTQTTEKYSTKKPYDFDAGGSGSDLLRMKIFSERYHFNINFVSSRCKYLPNETDGCPGRISLCKFVKDKSGCLASGGSLFSVEFTAGHQ